MISTLRNAWKIPEMRKRIIFTLLMLLVIRLGSSIPVPYMDKEVISQIFKSGEGGLLQFLDLISGGTLSNFSIFALSIYPYITSSIIIQLLTIAIPKLEELAKEGEEGRKKINRYTRYAAIILAVIQAVGTTFGLFKNAIVADSSIQSAVVIISLVAGTTFLMWVGNLITERGIGNGISLIIFIGIVSGLPSTIIYYVQLALLGVENVFKLLLAVVAVLK